MAKQPEPRSRRQVERAVRRLLDAGSSDRTLLAELDQLAEERAFPGLTWLWGPVLYRRDPVLFRPFCLRHFAQHAWIRGWTYRAVKWKRHRDVLEPWLAATDERDDIALFRNLKRWQLATRLGGIDGKRYEAELVDRFTRARTPAARAVVLQKYDDWMELDERSAVALYREDRRVAAAYILRHLPWRRKRWEDLSALALDLRDEDFHYRLYRRQVGMKEWSRDVLALADRERDAERLLRELERHHPEGGGLNLADTFHALVDKRGRDVMPYVLAHVRDVWSRWWRSGHDRMLALARERAWLDLWSALILVSSRPKEFNAEVVAVLDDDTLDERARVERLGLLGGVAREWNWPGFGLAQVKPLDDDTACRLYDAHPELLRGPFKLNVAPTFQVRYPRFSAAVMEAGDEALVDFIASRLVTRQRAWGGRDEKHLLHEAERYSHYYDGLRADERTFTRRAAAVLTAIPAYAIWSYGDLIRSNRLARLLFEHSLQSYLAVPEAVTDLVESSEIHVQQLAYRVLGLDDPRARAIAHDNLEMLVGTLLRPLHRRTRAAAFAALHNAASTEEAAARVLDRARAALRLPDERYPKDRLVGLIGRLLHRHPDLRRAGEVPVVHGLVRARS